MFVLIMLYFDYSIKLYKNSRFWYIWGYKI